MAVIVWSKQSLGDVDAIAAYIKRDQHFYAKAVVAKFNSTAQAILLFPRVRHIVSELNDDLIRERFVCSYRLIYQINDNHVEILAVIHGKRILDVADITL